MNEHWATKYIGTPWVPREFECWHLVAEVYEKEFGILLPSVEGAGSDLRLARTLLRDHREKQNWFPLEPPQEGCVVLMARGNRPSHVGVYIHPGFVLHSVETAGGIITPLGRLEALGYGICGFYGRVEMLRDFSNSERPLRTN